MTWVRQIAALAVVLVAACAWADQRTVDAAIQREAAGDYAGAAAALEKLAREAPDDPFADDALFEAAVLAEERLADPARAARLYDEVATKYAQSRLSRRARARADFLTASLRSGAGPLTEFQRLTQSGAQPPDTAGMERLLAAHPDFALADRALYWLGARYLEAHREPDGVARLLELERRFPSSEWAPRAKKARAELLLKQRHPLEARRLFAELAASSSPMVRAAGREGLGDVRAALVRGALAAAALAYLVAFALLHLVRLGGMGRLRQVPTEVLYYLPVAALFVVAGATENAAIGWATAAIAVGGAAVIWLGAALTARRLERGPVPTVGRLARSAATALAVLAVAYLAVQSTGLTDLVVETLRAGPER
jgi:hypothetical protein